MPVAPPERDLETRIAPHQGEMLLGSAQSAPLFVPNPLSLSLPLPYGLTLVSALHYFLAALGAFLLARWVLLLAVVFSEWRRASRVTGSP